MAKTILVVEDDTLIRKDIALMLQLNDFNIIEAANGRIALNYIKEEVPDLIICDVLMHEMNGYELLEELQKHQEYSSIPFLFLSALAFKPEMRKGMKLGADDYITKPFDFEELLMVISTRLKKRELLEQKYQKKLDDLRKNLRRSLPHEIRTPLNSIIGFSDILVKSFAEIPAEEAMEMLTHINEAGLRLNRLFDKYLLYANLEILMSSTKDLNILRNSTIEYTASIIREYSELILTKYDRYDDAQFDLKDASIRISEEYLLKLLEEVLENSCKFSEKGTNIVVKSRAYSKMFELSVKDSGRGMSQEQIDNYDAYIQFNRKIYEQQGSGLGLAIVKAISNIFDGKFNISSTPDKETVVSVKIPIVGIK